MKRDWIDADFEVVGDHYRAGERHRDRKRRRWRFTGRHDAWGRPLWYRPPRLNKWQYGLVLVVAVLLVRAVLILGWEVWQVLHR